MRRFRGVIALAAVAAALVVGAFATPSRAAELAPLAAPAAPAYAAAPSLGRAASGRVVFDMAISEPLEHQVFALGPSQNAEGRLVVDFPELTWRLPIEGTDDLRAPGVRGVRFGLYREGRSRMVFDLDGAPRVTAHEIYAGRDGRPRFRIEFAVGAASGAASGAKTGFPTGAIEAAAAAPLLSTRPAKRPKPLIVAVDAGHGGRDPGAVHGGVQEKDVTLLFARELRDVLRQPGRVEVVMIRDRDEFVHLGQRVQRALEARADLFISIHADATLRNADASGASVYTLSDVASDRLAADLAERENAADTLGGVEIAERENDVRRILVDLAKRRTGGESERFAELLVGQMSRHVKVLEQRPHRFAGFRVLKTFDTPAVLLELGFLTNRGDRRRLLERDWRRKAQVAIAEAIRRWDEGDRAGFVDASAPR